MLAQWVTVTTFAITALIFTPQAVHAQLYVNADTTLNSTISDVVIGESGHGGVTNPIVDIVTGADIVFASSYNTSTVNITGGTVSFSFSLSNNSTVSMSGGVANAINGFENSKISMSGGVTNNLVTYNMSTANLSGGRIDNELSVWQDAMLTISGGTSALLMAFDNGIVTMSGGGITDNLYGNGGNVFGFHSSIFTITGGSSGHFFAYDNSHFRFFGIGLTSVLDNPNILASGAGGTFFFTRYALGGTLNDGTSLAGRYLYVQNGSTASFSLTSASAPEPSALAFLTLGGGLLVTHRRRPRR